MPGVRQGAKSDPINAAAEEGAVYENLHFLSYRRSLVILWILRHTGIRSTDPFISRMESR